jgi:dicarboxylate/amino acid:cation (Na+ or H+) symporter, DAACS family
MLAALVLGAALGATAHAADPAWLETLVSTVSEPIGKIFLRLLFMLVIPLVLSALPLGIAGLGDLRALGRIGLRTLLYTVAVSAIAVLIGVAMVNLFQPGAGLAPELKERLRAAPAPAAATSAVGVELVLRLVPDNVVRAMAESDLLAVMVFAVFLGAGLAAVRSEPTRRLEEVLQGLYDVVMWLLGAVIRLAPIGIFCLVFTLTARLGFEVLRQLAAYVAVVIGALSLHMFGVYSLSVAWLGRMSPLRFFAAARPAILTAFSTSSSNATLPTALLVADRGLGLPSHISRFVLTLGATANQNGTALFEGVTVLFLAQFYGIELRLGQQLLVVSICVLGGIGTAGVPAGSIPVVIMILGLVGIPVEGIGLVLGVDRFLDMCRTTVNVTGDLAAAVVVARGEQAAGGEAIRPGGDSRANAGGT